MIPVANLVNIITVFFTGNQPVGSMTFHMDDNLKLPGFSVGTILIKYDFLSGIQGPNHPNPGVLYQAKNFPRVAYLPNNQVGINILWFDIFTFQFEFVSLTLTVIVK
jgi:hypothetical protein